MRDVHDRKPYVFITVPPDEANRQPPALSVIIPTYNHRASLARTLQGLAQQTAAPSLFEVVVVSDGSTDGTSELCASLATPYRLRCIEQTHSGAATARNVGVEAAEGTLLLFLDDDAVPHPALVAEHLRFHRRDPRAIVFGPMLAPTDAKLHPWLHWQAQTLLSQYADMERGRYDPTPRQFSVGNSSVAREAVVTVGGFDAEFGIASDVELAYRLEDQGLSLYFAPEAVVWHYASRPLRSWLVVPQAYGRADALMATEQERIWILPDVGAQFQEHQRRFRRFARLVVGSRRRCGFGVWLLVRRAWLARLLPGARGKLAADRCYAAMYALRYWQGLCDILGRRQFWYVVELYADPTRARRVSAPLTPTRY